MDSTYSDDQNDHTLFVKWAEKFLPEINQFLFQMGLNSTHRNIVIKRAFKEIRNTYLDEPPGRRRVLLYKKAAVTIQQNIEHQEHNESDEIFVHLEDRELHELLQKLPEGHRAAVVLTAFHKMSLNEISIILQMPEAETEGAVKEGKKKLIHKLEEMDGERISEENLDKLLGFLLYSYNKIPLSVDVSELVEEPAAHSEEVNHVPFYRSKWALSLSGLLIAGLIVLFLAQPSSDSSVEPEMSSAENNREIVLSVKDGETIDSLEELGAEVEDRMQKLEADLGLSEGELYQVEYIQKAINQIQAFLQRNQLAEEGELNPFEIQDALNRLVTPLTYVQQEEFSSRDEYALAIHSDMITKQYLEMAESLMEQYDTALEEYESELEGLGDQPIEDFSFSPEAAALLDKIAQNGYETVVTPDQNQFELSIGGEKFSEVAELQIGSGKINNAYIEYIRIMREKLPFVEAEQLQLSMEQVPDVLLEAERLLKGMMYTEPLAEELLSQHELLLEFLVKDSASNSIFTEEGMLMPDVKAVWETLIGEEKLRTYASSRYVHQFYAELEENDFRKPQEWQSFQSEQGTSPVLGYMVNGPDSGLFPLNDELNQLYNQYQAEKESTLLSGLTEKETMQMYLNAISIGDLETLYSLFAETEDRPDREAFLRETNRENLYNQDLTGVAEITEIGSSEGIKQMIIVLSDGALSSSQKVIPLKEENGSWKIVYQQGDFLITS
ncbi:sigma-70 family RNA polymerase sigma factor [Jeotgalibacillus sp. ET6]|uniref:RNA polymerase sigma factor n=1 Tax=Jeotgalibacillus sp. ET6 TaxID=3037260 RepID=UPI0024181761|nr:sigma-70 family RNA polymerase sigma factor [Jeotgalibacillus sp. ET6]MDG5471819.1 sigma-70 family RNA polymerase sigma factor [Jeotgalibacillus sp. ET6]